jgi:hypothetical protein
MAIPFCMNFFIQPGLAAIGRSRTIAKGAVVQTVATLGLSMLAAPYGPQWVAAAYVLRAYLTMPYHLTLFKRDTGIGMIEMMRSIMPPFLAAQAMVGSLLIISPFLRSALGSGAIYLAVAVLFGATVFAAALLLFAASYVRSNFQALQPLWKGRRPEAAAL